MGRRRSSDLTGVLVVDKPAGMTSHDVVDRIRRVTGQRRTGHTGTLDPDATGVLVVCLGRATRLVRFLQAGRKTYTASMVLGVETSTQDAAGDVVAEHDASHVTEDELCHELKALIGDIEQIPPMVSAVKVGGERLYEKARRGEEVEREPRQVTIHDLLLESFQPGARATATFLVTCSAGTYVRTIAHDVGRALEVGGSLTALRRVANGPFTTDLAVGLDELAGAAEEGRLDQHLLDPLGAVGRMLPVVSVEPDVARGLVHGQTLEAQGQDGPYAVAVGDRLVGIYADRDGKGRPEVVLARPDDLSDQDPEAENGR